MRSLAAATVAVVRRARVARLPHRPYSSALAPEQWGAGADVRLHQTAHQLERRRNFASAHTTATTADSHASTTRSPRGSGAIAAARASRARAKSSDPLTIGFVTDTEGNMRHFDRCVTMSDVVDWAPDSTPQAPKLELRPGKTFVFGGDLFDKGPADIRLARCLTDLKRRYPDRVFLIIGNRDHNKLRLTSELDTDDLARPVDSIPAPYWVGSRGVTFANYLRESQAAGDTRSLQELSTPTNKLRYMLRYTMGCPNTFEFRRQELALLKGTGGDVSIPPDDEAVTQSFLTALIGDKVDSGDALDAPPHDGPWMYAYLRSAQLGVVLGDTMFVHGAVHADNMRFVPDDDSGDGPSMCRGGHIDGDAHDWIESLNEWYRRALLDWERRPTWDSARSAKGAQALMGYGHGLCAGRSTVMVQSYMDRKQHPTDVPLHDAALVEYLRQSGVRRVCVGHQPFGDSPTVVRTEDVEVVNGDTSFSDVGWGQRVDAASHPDIDTHEYDTRGEAASEVVVRVGPGSETSACRIHGTHASGASFDFALPEMSRSDAAGGYAGLAHDSDRAEDEDEAWWLSHGGGDPFIGKQTNDGWWFKSRVNVSNGEPASKLSYLASRGDGFTVDYRWVPEHEVPAQVAAQRNSHTGTTAGEDLNIEQ